MARAKPALSEDAEHIFREMTMGASSPWCKQRISCKEGDVAGQAISRSTWHGCGDSTSAKPILIYPTREE